jgi:signal transduction histidine kinase
VSRAAQEVDAVQVQVDHVQQILADQQRFSRAERVLEPLALAELLAQTVRLLPDAMRQGLRVEIDPGLEAVGAVRAARVALQQVLGNLLINAAEAMQGAGRVHIAGGEEEVEGVRVAHLRVQDEGCGIAPEHLPHLFERGFSTKGRGSGMGLHWSANTVTALGGRLYAESEGPGQGATLHLLLPLAGPTAEHLEDAA